MRPANPTVERLWREVRGHRAGALAARIAGDLDAARDHASQAAAKAQAALALIEPALRTWPPPSRVGDQRWREDEVLP